METITIRQMMAIELLNEQFKDTPDLYAKELVKLFYEEEVPFDKFNEIITNLNILMSETDFPLVRRFEINGVEYGFHTDLKTMLTSEYIDLDSWLSQGQPNRILAVLYRPITKSVGELYEIEPYQGTSKYSDIMLDVDWKVYKGTEVFFWLLRISLLNSLSISTQRRKKKTMKWLNIRWQMYQFKKSFLKSFRGIKCYTMQRQRTS